MHSPKDRLALTPDGEAGLNYLCAGLKHFFSYGGPYLQRMAAFRQSGEPMEPFMHLVRSGDAAASRQTGRNDPCPCGSGSGSGKKYKRYCLVKLSS